MRGNHCQIGPEYSPQQKPIYRGNPFRASSCLEEGVFPTPPFPSCHLSHSREGEAVTLDKYCEGCSARTEPTRHSGWTLAERGAERCCRSNPGSEWMTSLRLTGKILIRARYSSSHCFPWQRGYWLRRCCACTLRVSSELTEWWMVGARGSLLEWEFTDKRGGGGHGPHGDKWAVIRMNWCLA